MSLAEYIYRNCVTLNGKRPYVTERGARFFDLVDQARKEGKGIFHVKRRPVN